MLQWSPYVCDSTLFIYLTKKKGVRCKNICYCDEQCYTEMLQKKNAKNE